MADVEISGDRINNIINPSTIISEIASCFFICLSSVISVLSAVYVEIYTAITSISIVATICAKLDVFSIGGDYD